MERGREGSKTAGEKACLQPSLDGVQRVERNIANKAGNCAANERFGKRHIPLRASTRKLSNFLFRHGAASFALFVEKSAALRPSSSLVFATALLPVVIRVLLPTRAGPKLPDCGDLGSALRLAFLSRCSPALGLAFVGVQEPSLSIHMVWREVRTCFLCTLFSFVAASASRLPYMLSGRILQPAARSLASFSLTRFASNTAPMSRPKVVVLSGATSVGKSGAAMELANVLNGEIIVADSVQVYKGLDVGANKPSLADQQQVRHHLIDIFETSEDVSAAEFCERAVEAVKDVVSRGRTPIFVGGSTMWLRWLVDGIPEAPPASPESIERAAELIGAFEQSGDWDSAIRVLQSYSAELASKTERNNWHRLHRYLQISLDLTASSKEVRFQDQRTPLLQDYDVRCFFLMEERNQLYHTIDSRCLQMLCHGLVGEVGRLLLEGKLLPDQIASRAIGYRQTIDYFCKRDIPSADVHEFLQYIR